MGHCLSSNARNNGARRKTTSRGGDIRSSGGGVPYGGGPMSGSNTKNRVESIQETKTATFGGLQVRYAYLSQRGYYPDGTCHVCSYIYIMYIMRDCTTRTDLHITISCVDPEKANQDAYCVQHDFGGEPTDAFFAVFDGHGKDGDKCAQFARDQLPLLAEKFVARTKTREEKLLQVRNSSSTPVAPLELTKDQIQSSMLKAHIECNRNMHRAHTLDDSLSGTTSICAYIHGRRNRITICNVGDSRAILGQEAEGTIKALPLSRDQTPYRRDERARIRKTGARILSLDQIEGVEPILEDDDEENDLELGEELDEGGDPPRVWSPIGEYPGTAFTRSLGDAIAEELGVFAEPEMLTRELSAQDKIIVLASDGVFEFLTNQSVIDMCAKFSDPLEACRAVVAESYELWLQYELRTDDITMICIFVDGVDNSKLADSFVSAASSRTLTTADANDNASEDPPDTFIPAEKTSCKPVRVHISKEKQEALRKMKIKMSMQGLEETLEDVDLSKLYTEKTPEEKARIAEAIRASVMFQNITDEERELIFGVMEPIEVKKGTWVIKQGTVGDRFYIVDTGRFEVRIVPEGEEDDGSGGNVVHVYEGSVEKHAHPSFGELALMYSAPRAASIVAQTDGQLWALHRYAFRQVLAQQSGRKELIHTLKKIDAFRKMKSKDIQTLATSMEELTFGRGETIITQGNKGDAMFVILNGSVGECIFYHNGIGIMVGSTCRNSNTHILVSNLLARIY